MRILEKVLLGFVAVSLVGCTGFSNTPINLSSVADCSPYRPEMFNDEPLSKKDVPSATKHVVKPEKFEKKYTYPSKIDSFNLIYKRLCVTKDEFTTTIEHNKKMENIANNIKTRGDIIFRVSSSLNKGKLVYDADLGCATITIPTFPFRAVENNRISYKSGILLNKKVKVENKVGINAYGAKKGYSSYSGFMRLVSCDNIASLKDLITADETKIKFFVEASKAKKLRHNLEILLVVDFGNQPAENIATASYSSSDATFSDPTEHFYILEILNCRAKAILICDKQSKKIIHTEYY